MNNDCEKVSVIAGFISAIQRAWPGKNRQFNEKDEKYYSDQLVSFCNESLNTQLSGNDFQSLFFFLSNSIQHLLDLFISEEEKSDYVFSCMEKVRLLLKHLSLYCVIKPTQVFFEKELSFLLEYPFTIEETDIGRLVTFYYKSGLFEDICTYAQKLHSVNIPDELLSSFMKCIRRSEYELTFLFLLFPSNPTYFRRNNKIYPDECCSKDLYYGIHSHYFMISPKNDVHQVLLEQCENVPEDMILDKSFDNPVYVYWSLFKESFSLPINDLYPFIDKLFCH